MKATVSFELDLTHTARTLLEALPNKDYVRELMEHNIRAAVQNALANVRLCGDTHADSDGKLALTVAIEAES